MNYTYYSFYTLKFMPSIIIFIEFESLIMKTISNPTGSYLNIIVVILLIFLQSIMFKIQYIELFIDRFEILGWNKYDIKNWNKATSLDVIGSGSPNIGRIKLKNGKKIYFANYKFDLRNMNIFKKRGLDSNLDLVEKIKFMHSV